MTGGALGTILNIGMTDAKAAQLAQAHWILRRAMRFMSASSAPTRSMCCALVRRTGFEGPMTPRLAKAEFEQENGGDPFPQNPAEQLAEVLKSMARAWEGTTARLLRQAQGAPADAGLGLVVQEMALGIGQASRARRGAVRRPRQPAPPQVTGRWLPQGAGAAAVVRKRCAVHRGRHARQVAGGCRP